MERLLHHLYLELLPEFNVALVGPAGCRNHVQPGTTVSECPLSPVFRFLVYCQWTTYRTALRLRPDLVISGSGVTAPAAVFAARAIGAPALCYLHGLDLVAENRLYQKLFVPTIRKCDVLVVNSSNTARLARDSDLVADRLFVLHPGVLLPPASSQSMKDVFKRRIGTDKSTILLSVGRLTARKGLAEFVAHVMPGLVARRPDLLLVVIGGEPKDALSKSGGEQQRIEEAISTCGLSEHVAMLGTVDDETLEQAYYGSDLMIFPVIDLPGDVEGFGMVAVEAAAHGLPTVAFAAGGVPDAVKHGVSGYLVNPGDYASFGKAITAYLHQEDPVIWRARCLEFASNFSWSSFGRELRQICRDVTFSALKS